MAFKMIDDSRTTLEHKTPESNKSLEREGFIGLSETNTIGSYEMDMRCWLEEADGELKALA